MVLYSFEQRKKNVQFWRKAIIKEIRINAITDKISTQSIFLLFEKSIKLNERDFYYRYI